MTAGAGFPPGCLRDYVDISTPEYRYVFYKNIPIYIDKIIGMLYNYNYIGGDGNVDRKKQR